MANKYSNWISGIGKSRSDDSGFDNLKNVDVHTELGYATPQLKLEADAGANAPDEQCIMAKTPAGTIYAFSVTSGKRWKYASDAWSTLATNAQTKHYGAKYFDGKVYYSTATKLGFFVAETEGSIDDTWVTWSGTSVYRPMAEVNLKLYIGNENNVASITAATPHDATDPGTMNQTALDLPESFNVTALTNAGTDLMIGSFEGLELNKCSVFIWDTYSDSWIIEDVVPETGVNCFITGDNIIFAQCGKNGQLYYWDGSRMVNFRQLRGVVTAIGPYKSTTLKGRPLYATEQAVFSIHRTNDGLPYAIVQEYTTTTTNISSITSTGNQLVVSTEDGMDKTGTTYADAIIDSPEYEGDANNVIVDYDSIPAGTDIEISTSVDQGSYTAQTVIKDTIRKKAYFNGGLGDTNFVQARATLTSNGTAKSKIRLIEIA